MPTVEEALTAALASLPTQPTLISAGEGRRAHSKHWMECRDADSAAREIFRRHYSYRPFADGRDPLLFVGPGEKLVLITRACDALFVWRRFISADGQRGVNCSVFRNESKVLSSVLILEAEQVALLRWPQERMFTYVNPRKVRSVNPGYCFLQAGWTRCGITKSRRLLILEKHNS